jgi:shikimate dehydrogenase
MDKSTAAEHLFGLIGYPLSHSFSKKYFSDKFTSQGIKGHHYELFPLEDISQLPDLISRYPNLRGLNVTIPYKQAVMDYLDTLDTSAAEIGAVNTIKIEEGRLKGYNTDVYGFELSLLQLIHTAGAETGSLSALILGTGGAAKAVAYVLTKLGIEYMKVSRRPSEGQLSYQQLNQPLMEKYRLVINTTPLGMSPKESSLPDIPYAFVNSQHLFYDLVYNPDKTAFMKKGASRGASVKNGLEMLHLQAEKAWEIWNEPK